MKFYVLALFTAAVSVFFAQQSEDIIPKDAVTVFSINNINVLQKVSMDELVSYEFMAELQSELFDGSTQGKTLKDSGIDFNQKMNIFYGKNTSYEISGFTFGISDKDKLFTVFDDFDRVEGAIAGVEYYNNYFNHLMIRGNSALLIRVDTDQQQLTELTDSIWYARGYEPPFQDYYDEYDGYEDEIPYDPTLDDGGELAPEDGDVIEEVIIEDSLNSEIEVYTDEEVVVDDLSIAYYELRDSLENELSRANLYQIAAELFIKGEHLKKRDTRFAEQLTHNSDGIFYLDNSRNFKNANNLWYFQNAFPDLYKDLDELYTGNVMLGDIYLREKTIDIELDALYGSALGEIYQELNNSKFDKAILNYIPQTNSGFFTYNIDLKAGYEKAIDIILPILKAEPNPRIASNVLTVELMNEFINTDAVFNTYKGTMFGTFNGIQRVKTKRIDFLYDEETFEYQEREVEGEEDMPIFTLGFSTGRPDIPEKILKYLSGVSSRFKNMGNYWQYDDAILNSVPLYIINKNGLFIFTNDEDLAKNHSDGYGSRAISGKLAKAAKKSGSVYGYMNWGDILSKIPKDMFSSKENELLDSMRGKTGVFEVTSTKTSTKKTSYFIQYQFDGNYNNAGKYLLDLVNSAYILSK